MLPMTEETRGEAIRRRRQALSFRGPTALERTIKNLAAESGVGDPVNRDALADAERGVGSEDMFVLIESWLDRLERARDPNNPPSLEDADRDDDVMEIVVEDVFGIGRIAAKGPVVDRDELVDSLAKLIAKIRGDQGD